MDILQAIVLGIIQGITEWLPISSSGQVVLSLIEFLQMDPQAAFSFAIILHIGTLLAVVVKFRNEIIDILKKLSWNDKLTRFLIVSTIVTAIIGVPVYFVLKSVFAYAALANAFISALLIVTGIVLYLSRELSYGNTDIEQMGYKEMTIAGAVQGISILPGISRSGTTIAAMLLMGIKQETALTLSFLMSIPAVAGAVVLDFAGADFAAGAFSLTEVITGIIVAFIFGYLTMDILLKIAHKVRFDLFCIILGLIAVTAFFL